MLCNLKRDFYCHLQPITWKVENSDLFRLKANGKKEVRIIVYCFILLNDIFEFKL